LDHNFKTKDSDRMALPGYNPTASLLPQGGGTIHAMSGGGLGGGVGIPPTPTYNASQSLIQEASGHIAPFRGGADPAVGPCYLMEDLAPPVAAAAPPAPAAPAADAKPCYLQENGANKINIRRPLLVQRNAVANQVQG
jgi:hypothetical protein